MSDRKFIAEFWKPARGPLELTALWVGEPVKLANGEDGLSRTGYDVNLSRCYGYIFDRSSGGMFPEAIHGIYWTSEPMDLREEPCQNVWAGDHKPWRHSKTLAIQKRNATRRLKRLPLQFCDGEDLLDWLETNGMEDEAVWCRECDDYVTGEDLCEHCWWCDATGWYSTPSERCSLQEPRGMSGRRRCAQYSIAVGEPITPMMDPVCCTRTIASAWSYTEPEAVVRILQFASAGRSTTAFIAGTSGRPLRP